MNLPAIVIVVLERLRRDKILAFNSLSMALIICQWTIVKNACNVFAWLLSCNSKRNKHIAHSFTTNMIQYPECTPFFITSNGQIKIFFLLHSIRLAFVKRSEQVQCETFLVNKLVSTGRFDRSEILFLSCV
mmetsp:Transcript_1111/g.2350  ORF Transcript_1111/g.2350 Transcript_1111/m.2350 type:complete len:131 (+) Transcript_1111:158-550(+)